MRKINKKSMTAFITLLLIIMSTSLCFASGGTTAPTINDILQPMNVIKALVIAAISTVGSIFLVKEAYGLAIAIKQQDSPSMGQALLGIVAGLIMVGVGIFMAILGF